MQIRDRIKELRRVPADQLRPNPKNWRTHPPAQQDALRGVLAEIGYAGALLARELDDGTLELIDGHLRAETTPEFPVPVLILDLSADEADKLLATHDPLAAMAGVDPDAVRSLLSSVATDNAAVQAMLSKVAAQAQLENYAKLRADRAKHEPEVPALFQIVVECENESQQQEVYDRLTTEGFKCRVLTL
jgi:ParB-like chromosome segregation protein Spo0J